MLYLSGIILSLFLAFVLLTKKPKSDADRLLIGWLILMGFHLFSYYIYTTGQSTRFPTLVVLGFPLPLVHGPFLYLYTKQQTSRHRFNTIQLLHFVPVIASYLLFAGYYFLPAAEKVTVMQQKGQGYEIQLLINLAAVCISGIVYIGLSVIHLLRYKKSIADCFSNTEKVNFNWLLYLIVWMMLIWIVILTGIGDTWVFGAAALFVIWLGYFGIKQVQVFSQTTALIQENDRNELTTVADSIKYQKSALTEEQASLIHAQLLQLMKEEKPFCDPDLTLDQLARKLDVHPNHLSQVINSRENRNFYDLVNEHRVEEFIQLVSQPSGQQYTFMSMAYDCGFNSKASFNRNFKKYTGLTPSEYLKNQTQSGQQRIIAQGEVSSLMMN